MHKDVMAGKKQLIMEWYRVFGWHSSPFEDEVLEPIENFIVGHDKERERINYFLIENKRFGTISGESGNGKTMLLTWLRKQLEKYPDRVIADFFVGSDNDFIENVVWSVLTFGERAYVRGIVDSPLRAGAQFIRRKLQRKRASLIEVFECIRKKQHRAEDIQDLLRFVKGRCGKRNLVILIDDVGFMSQHNLTFLKALLYEDFPVQIIAAGTSNGIERSQVKKFGEKDSLHIRLRALPDDEFKELISKRIAYYGGKGTHPLSESELHKLYEKGNRNIKRALNLCADATIKLALRQKQHEKAGTIATAVGKIKGHVTGELDAFEKSADINKILTSVQTDKKKEEKEDEEYQIKVIEREPASYKIKEVGEKRHYKIKESKRRKK